MGNRQSQPSRVHYQKAQQAYTEAQRLSRQNNLPRPTGAILAYLDGRIDALEAWSQCTYLEFNEFARLDPPGIEDWFDRHDHQRACNPNTRHCAVIDGGFHCASCPRFRRLPRHIAIGNEVLDRVFGAGSSDYTDDDEDDGSGSYDDSSVEEPHMNHGGGHGSYGGGAFGAHGHGGLYPHEMPDYHGGMPGHHGGISGHHGGMPGHHGGGMFGHHGGGTPGHHGGIHVHDGGMPGHYGGGIFGHHGGGMPGHHAGMPGQYGGAHGMPGYGHDDDDSSTTESD